MINPCGLTFFMCKHSVKNYIELNDNPIRKKNDLNGFEI